MYGYMPMYYFDPTYVLIIIGVLLSMGASAKLNAIYGRYSSVASPGSTADFTVPGNL